MLSSKFNHKFRNVENLQTLESKNENKKEAGQRMMKKEGKDHMTLGVLYNVNQCKFYRQMT